MNRLVILANAFPWGTWEPFLETEIPFFSKFERIDIISLSVRRSQLHKKRPLPTNTKAHAIPYRSKIFYFIYSFCLLFNPLWYSEIVFLIRNRKFTLARLIQLAVFLTRARYEARCARKLLKKCRLDPADRTVFYAYRFAYQPLVTAFLRDELCPNGTVIARAHRADLYQEFAPNNYLPLRLQVASSCEEIHLISQHGVDYLKRTLPKKFHNKLKLYRLGTVGSTDGKKVSTPADRLQLVSCSNLVPVKRISLLIAALSQVTLPITWTHFGSGELESSLKTTAANVLPPSVNVVWKGNTPNKEVISNLNTNRYDLFINVSSSEGVPVSIMEALAASIPILATDVGGTGEIVDDSVGSLVAADINSTDLAKEITHLLSLLPRDRENMRVSARKRWEDMCDANKLYTQYADHLLTLAENSSNRQRIEK